MIVREAEQIKIIFVIFNLSETVEWEFEADILSQSDLPERYGQHPQLFLGRRGAVVEQTYCETVFQDCRIHSCYVQSPGYPGVYPRGISCRYRIITSF